MMMDYPLDLYRCKLFDELLKYLSDRKDIDGWLFVMVRKMLAIFYVVR